MREDDGCGVFAFGAFGCAGIIIVILFFFVACSGVTVDGKQYTVGCSCDDGVTVESER